jgi:hypothetical protein
MKKIILCITLLTSSTMYVSSLNSTSIACPCVTKIGDASCCCAGTNQACNCVEMFEKTQSVPVSCPCPKINNATQRTDTPSIEVSHGELFDKVTILEIKSKKIDNQAKLQHVMAELNTLNTVLNTILENNIHEKALLMFLKDDLASINLQLWDVEDKIHKKEMLKQHDAEFITLARSIGILNTIRCTLKTKISEILNSPFLEQKSYPVIK